MQRLEKLLYTLVSENLILGENLRSESASHWHDFARSALKEKLSSNPQERLVIWVAPAHELLGAALEAGASLEAAEADLKAVMNDALAIFASARRRVLLAPRAASFLHNDEIAQKLGAYFSEGEFPEFIIKEADPCALKPILLAYEQVAKLIIESSDELLGLSARFDASMAQCVVSDRSRGMQARAALFELESMGRDGADMSQASLAGMPEHTTHAQRVLINDLQVALEACQKELENYYKTALEAPGKAEAQELKRKFERIKLERDRLKDELAAVKEQYYWLQQDADQHREALSQMRNSTSWRLTGFLRKMRGGASSASAGGDQ